MSDLDVQAPRAASVALVATLSVTSRALLFEPGLKELGGVEMVLKGSDDIGRGDALRLVDGCCTLALFLTVLRCASEHIPKTPS
jgi:hypothetical protein